MLAEHRAVGIHVKLNFPYLFRRNGDACKAPQRDRAFGGCSAWCKDQVGQMQGFNRCQRNVTRWPRPYADTPKCTQSTHGAPKVLPFKLNKRTSTRLTAGVRRCTSTAIRRSISSHNACAPDSCCNLSIAASTVLACAMACTILLLNPSS